MTRNIVWQLLALIFVLALLALLGGALMFVTHPRFGDYPQAVWWAFLHLTDTGYLGEDKDVPARVIAVVLTFSGAILFLGGVVAILTNGLNRFLDSLSQGRSAVVEEGHFLIVGEGQSLPTLIEELCCAIAQKFDEGPLPSVVVLAEELGPLALRRVRAAVPSELSGRIRLATRQGSPLEGSSLERVDYLRAQAIVILSMRDRLSPLASDLSVLRTFVSIHSRAAAHEVEPRCVLDLSRPTSALLLETMERPFQVETLASLEFMGRLLCQTLRFPGIGQVYRQLLSDAWGESVHLLPAQKICPLGSALRGFVERCPHGQVLGFVRGRQTRLLDFSTPLEAGDEVVLLSGAPAAAPDGRQCALPNRPQWPVEVLVVGLNEALFPLLRELSRYQGESYRLTILSEAECELERRLQRVEFSNVKVEVERGKLTELEDLAALPERPYNRVLLLAPERSDGLTADAETALQFALLSGPGRFVERPNFVVELHDPHNREIFPQGCDVLVSDQIVSHMLAQVALKPAWHSIYEELFTFGGAELTLRTWQDAFSDGLGVGDELPWRQVVGRGLELGFLCLGLEERGRMRLRPAPDETFRVSAEARLLLLEDELRPACPKESGQAP